MRARREGGGGDLLSRSVPWLMSALLAGLAVAMGRGALENLRHDPVFHYTQDVFTPLAPVCPGDDLQYRSEYRFTAGDYNAVQIVRVLYDVQRGSIVKPDNEVDWYVWTATDNNRPIATVINYKLPADLKEGNYELRVAASLVDSRSTGYRVPFSIPESCFKNEVKK